MVIGAGTRPVLGEGASNHEVQMDLVASGRGMLKWRYAEGGGGGWLPWMRCESVAGTGRVLRVPLLALSGRGFLIREVEVALEPVAVVWDFGNQINVGGTWKFGAAVHCQSGERWSGDFLVRVGGETARGKLSLAAGETGRIDVDLGLPSGDVKRLKQDVVLELTGEDGSKIVQVHEVEFSQNFGTGEWKKLAGKERYVSGGTGDPDLGDGVVSMRVAADRDALFVEFDLRGYELLPSLQSASVIVDLAIDARYYTERGSVGFVGPLVVNAGDEDGQAEVHLMELGVFGNGYDRKLLPRNVTGKLTTRGDGTRRISIVVPKAYFYLHEWALGNGNSQLGINANVSLMQASEEYPTGYYPLAAQFCLVNPGMSRRDARGLTTLELTEKPTKRWSVRVY
ncbi:MAG: hypothetical protein P8J87_08275, partial [Verrucomicrobiales bacterium]|nr:hypothetical protein [Verrucomicrobiales bacterium]